MTIYYDYDLGMIRVRLIKNVEKMYNNIYYDLRSPKNDRGVAVSASVAVSVRGAVSAGVAVSARGAILKTTSNLKTLKNKLTEF